MHGLERLPYRPRIEMAIQPAAQTRLDSCLAEDPIPDARGHPRQDETDGIRAKINESYRIHAVVILEDHGGTITCVWRNDDDPFPAGSLLRSWRIIE